MIAKSPVLGMFEIDEHSDMEPPDSLFFRFRNEMKRMPGSLPLEYGVMIRKAYGLSDDEFRNLVYKFFDKYYKRNAPIFE
jgi:hypothetical protein